MARIIRASTETKGKQGRKVKIRRQTYPLELKKKATSWKLVYGMKFTAIQKKLKDEYGIEVAMPTLYSWVANEKKSYCTWWPDNKFNPKQTSDPPKKWLVKSKTCQRIQDLRFDQLTSALPPHRYNEWKELLNKLENLTSACYNIIPATSTFRALQPSEKRSSNISSKFTHCDTSLDSD